MSALKDQVLAVREASDCGKGVEGPGRIVTRLNGEVLVGRLVRTDERCEEETKKWALATVRGLGVYDQSVVMVEPSDEDGTEKRWNV